MAPAFSGPVAWEFSLQKSLSCCNAKASSSHLIKGQKGRWGWKGPEVGGGEGGRDAPLAAKFDVHCVLLSLFSGEPVGKQMCTDVPADLWNWLRYATMGPFGLFENGSCHK